MGLSTVITKHILMSCTLSLYVRVMVENSGIEPLTSCMPCKRSPEQRGYTPRMKMWGQVQFRVDTFYPSKDSQ